MVLSCTVFEIKRVIGRENANYSSYHLVFNLHDALEPIRIFAQNFNTDFHSPCHQKHCLKVQVSA